MCEDCGVEQWNVPRRPDRPNSQAGGGGWESAIKTLQQIAALAKFLSKGPGEGIQQRMVANNAAHFGAPPCSKSAG